MKKKYRYVASSPPASRGKYRKCSNTENIENTGIEKNRTYRK
jgi:hypothetical protein